MPSTHEISRHAARGSLWRRWIRAPSWAAARWPLVVWEPGDSASQCHGVLNISEISPPSILWQQPAVTCDSFYLHTALHCTPHCNNARVPQFGLDNVINCWQATWLAKILKTVRQLQTSIEHPNFKCRLSSLKCCRHCIDVKTEEPYFLHSLHHTFLAPANKLRPQRMWLGVGTTLCSPTWSISCHVTRVWQCCSVLV